MTLRRPAVSRAFVAVLVASATCVPAAASSPSDKVITTTIATYDGEVSVAAKGDDVAVVVTAENGAPTILVGRGTQAPVPAEGIEPGASGPVHFGTTASGDTVLTYPRERDGRSGLYAWDLRTQVERPVAGLGGREVIEGVMDRGNVAYARLAGKTKTGISTDRTLMYKPAAGTARVLAAQGGHDLALGGGGVLQVVPSMASGTGLQTPILLQRVSLAGTVKTLRRVGVGEDFQQVLGPAFVDGAVQWLFTSLSGSTLFRQESDGPALQRRTGKVEKGIAYTGSSTAYAIRQRYSADEEMPHFDLVRLSRLTFLPAR